MKYFTLKESAEISKDEENLWLNISIPEIKIKCNAFEKINALHVINTVFKCISFSYLENILMCIFPKAGCSCATLITHTTICVMHDTCMYSYSTYTQKIH